MEVLDPELASGLSAERFAREVQLAARLHRPHVVPVLSAGDAGGMPFCTRPFVRGQSLRDIKPDNVLLPDGIAVASVPLGDRERASARLDAALASPDVALAYVGVDRWPAALRGEPRFEAILARPGLPPSPIAAAAGA